MLISFHHDELCNKRVVTTLDRFRNPASLASEEGVIVHAMLS